MKTLIWIFVLLTIMISCKMDNTFDYPLVFTGDIINISDTSATFTAKITNQGIYAILESGFIWGVHPNDNQGIKIKNEVIPTDVYELNSNEKLLPGKTYYVRAYIQTEASITYGREVSFKIAAQEFNIGHWTKIFDESFHEGFEADIVRTSFTLNEITYIFFEDGKLFSYDRNANKFEFLKLFDSLYPDFSVVSNGVAYVFSVDAFYRFDRSGLNFVKLSVREGYPNSYATTGFLINDNIYVGLGGTVEPSHSKDFWEYSITNDTWHQIASFPGEERLKAYSLNINNEVYIGGGYNFIQWPYPPLVDLWNYNPESDQWTQKEKLPVSFTDLVLLQGVSTNLYGYCFIKTLLFEYNPIFNIWEKMADFNPGIDYTAPYIFAVGNKIFTMIVFKDRPNDVKYFKLWVYEK